MPCPSDGEISYKNPKHQQPATATTTTVFLVKSSEKKQETSSLTDVPFWQQSNDLVQ